MVNEYVCFKSAICRFFFPLGFFSSERWQLPLPLLWRGSNGIFHVFKLVWVIPEPWSFWFCLKPLYFFGKYGLWCRLFVTVLFCFHFWKMLLLVLHLPFAPSGSSSYSCWPASFFLLLSYPRLPKQRGWWPHKCCLLNFLGLVITQTFTAIFIICIAEVSKKIVKEECSLQRVWVLVRCFWGMFFHQLKEKCGRLSLCAISLLLMIKPFML